MSYILHNLERFRNAVMGILRFNVAEPRLGSILIRLDPLDATSWDNLKRNCCSGNIINVFKHIIFGEQIIAWLKPKDRGLLLTIYSEECGSNKDAGI